MTRISLLTLALLLLALPASAQQTISGAIIRNGTVAPRALTAASGTPSAATYYRGDGSWQAITSGYTLPIASASVLGGVKIGANVFEAADGTISVAAPSSVFAPGNPTAPSLSVAIAYYNGATAYAQATAIYLGTTVALEAGGAVDWQYSTDGTNFKGIDGTSATYYQTKTSQFTMPVGFSSGTFSIKCIDVNASGQTATPITASVAYSAPPSLTYTGTAPIAVSGSAISVNSATTSAPGVVQLESSSTDTTATDAVTANDTRLSNSRTPTGSAGGDLGGSYPSPTVAGLQGRSVASTAPTTGQVLTWQASSWGPATISSGTTYTGTAPITISGSTISASTATTSAAGVSQLETSSSDTSASHVVTANDTRLQASSAVQTAGSGSNYTLTASYATVTPGGGALSVALPGAGSYNVTATLGVNEDASNSFDDIYADFYNATSGAVVTSSERHISNLSLGKSGQINLSNFVITTGAATINVQAYNAAAARGVIDAARSIIQAYSIGSVTLPAFSPTNISGLALWLKADTGVTTSGSTVTAWADQSGNSNNFSATTGPTLVSSVVNGLPVVRFNGTNQYMVSSANSPNSPFTLFALVRTPSTFSSYFWLLASHSNAGVEWGAQSTYQQLISDYTAVIASSTESYAASTAYYLDTSYDGTNYKFYTNGTSTGSGTNTVSLTPSKWALGYNQAYGSQFMTGDVVEIIVYSSVLTSSQRSQVQAYLKSRGGL